MPTEISQNPGDWAVESVAFEMRFNDSYLIWDVSGELWAQLIERYPDLGHTTVAPQQQIFEAKNLQVTVETGLLRVVSRGEGAKDLTRRIGVDIFQLASRLLQLKTFTRAGYRITRGVLISDIDELHSSYSRFAPKNPNPFGEHAKLREFFVGNRYEVDTSGVYASIKLEKRTINVRIPWELGNHFDAMRKETHHLVSDADFYTIGSFERSSFDPEEWMSQAHRGIRRLWDKY